MKREERPFKDKDKDKDKDNFEKGGAEKRSFQRRRGCRFCVEPGWEIDHKDTNLLFSFLTERFKIIPRRISGNCAGHQRKLTLAVKRARHIAFVPYSVSQL